MSELSNPEHATIFALMKPKEGKEEELRTELLSLVEPTQAEEGCITYTVHQEIAQVAFVLYEVWRSREELEAHWEMPYIKDFVAKVPELLEGENDVHFADPISVIK